MLCYAIIMRLDNTMTVSDTNQFFRVFLRMSKQAHYPRNCDDLYSY